MSGRICYHNCETACNRAQLDDAVSIHAVERFLGDQALEHHWQVEPVESSSGKKIMVVGGRSLRFGGGVPSSPPGPRSRNF